MIVWLCVGCFVFGRWCRRLCVVVCYYGVLLCVVWFCCVFICDMNCVLVYVSVWYVRVLFLCRDCVCVAVFDIL